MTTKDKSGVLEAGREASVANEIDVRGSRRDFLKGGAAMAEGMAAGAASTTSAAAAEGEMKNPYLISHNRSDLIANQGVHDG